ncbi:hypothetical protein AXG93_2912s1320 [Marchantia polymorpha subsp. ruderalis]|uniref:Uncharacterized protein n=1 Tax=Marchantia polymorpha subsp. ruderalis TaxID=1480154 RepID=A0A176WIG1_MARPO|nr:hypothetical protein AXG93_2912s1320 [Marchantia polymorpha subsp. ruderalis]
MDMDVSGVRHHRARARTKKRAKRRMMTVEVSDSRVEKTVAPIVNTATVAAGGVMRPVELGVPLEVSVEVPADIPGRTFEGENGIGKSDFSVCGADTVGGGRRDTIDEDERGLGEGVSFERGDSGTGCCKGRRDGGRCRGHYTADISGGRDTDNDYEYDETQESSCSKGEWESATAFVRERKAQLWEKKTKCEVLQLNLEKESGRCAELEETCRGLRISNENTQKVIVDLVARLEQSREAYEVASKRSERLIITAEKREK